MTLKSSPTEFLLVYITTPNKETAISLGRTLVKDRLAACANIIPQIVSIYEWQGALVEESEATLLVKTHSSRYIELEKKIVELHPYDQACIIAMPIDIGNSGFLSWIKQQTTS